MASTGTAAVDVTITLDEGAEQADLQRVAAIVDAHEELTLLGSNEEARTVTAQVSYGVTVDAATGQFEATRDA